MCVIVVAFLRQCCVVVVSFLSFVCQIGVGSIFCQSCAKFMLNLCLCKICVWPNCIIFLSFSRRVRVFFASFSRSVCIVFMFVCFLSFLCDCFVILVWLLCHFCHLCVKFVLGYFFC